jgi:DNA mismatch endonuclease (patch repair protein)
MDTLTKAERSVRMALIRSKDTKPELAVRRLIYGMGYRYRLHGKNMPGHPDLVFGTRAKVIFVHGCFWHLHRNCPKCRPPKSKADYWEPKLQRNAERDKSVQQQLRRIGWSSLVIWECELANPERLMRKVTAYLDD